ncbi:hypothetical protein TRIUR3_14513 [Triticum urartu]|uniref:BRX domain-containing protein n=1 Tax=Triticum urartu TaxID=4572 RepID=M7Z1R6_TRIUA|nr:hypothetical protein TRIUR3_14513 [Triticum urartu]
MLACIACSTKDGGEDGSRAVGAPNGRDAGKSLTSQLLQMCFQLKDMVLKFSGSGKHYKATGSPSFRGNRFHRSSRLAAYPGIIDDSGFTSDGAGEAYSYTRTTSSAGAPSTTWDMPKINHGFQPHARNPSASWIPSIGEEAEDDEDDEEAVVLEEDRVPREWTAQVEPGVHITFVSIPGGAGNDLKRIRFSREMFNKWEAQRWWGENYDRVVELYNVQTFRQQGLSTPSSSIDDAMQASVSVSNASDLEAAEWVEQDEPGVHITIRALGDGTRELRRVRFRHAHRWPTITFAAAESRALT